MIYWVGAAVVWVVCCFCAVVLLSKSNRRVVDVTNKDEIMMMIDEKINEHTLGLSQYIQLVLADNPNEFGRYTKPERLAYECISFAINRMIDEKVKK